MGVYAENWKEIAFKVKESAEWKCAKCGRQCAKPGEFLASWTRSQRMCHMLQVHHWNRQPSDNRLENLVALCSGCHLSYHRGGRGNVVVGQLELDLGL